MSISQLEDLSFFHKVKPLRLVLAARRLNFGAAESTNTDAGRAPPQGYGRAGPPSGRQAASGLSERREASMFLATNRFRIACGKEEAFVAHPKQEKCHAEFF